MQSTVIVFVAVLAVALALPVEYEQYDQYDQLYGQQYGQGYDQHFGQQYGQQYGQQVQQYGQQFGQQYGQEQFVGGSGSQEASVHKEFYYVKPEDKEFKEEVKHFVVGKPRKDYRVVFVKAPSTQPKVKYHLKQAPQEEKTVIYVFAKKDKHLGRENFSLSSDNVRHKPEVHFLKFSKDQESAAAKQHISNGWQAFPDSNRLQHWDYKKALVHLQVIYGIFPYYKITVENRYTAPNDYIITISEGDLGLPNKYFYNIDLNNEIIRSYKLLLRDFAINMGIVSRQAELFADEIFHYEQRIANHIDNVQSSSMESTFNTVHSLSELNNLAPLLPITQTLTALFPHTKIKDDTEIMVQDIKVLRELSTVISTSDKKSINNFLVWSLARKLLPHLPQEYRNLTEKFEQTLYGHRHGYPRWLLCTKLVRDWLPFAVDTLKHSQEIDKISQMNNLQQHFVNNDKFLKLMYYSLRNQLQQSIKYTPLLTEQVKRFIKDKLTSMRLQIGIPEEELKNQTYVKMYYNDLLLNNLYFVEHLESIWSFRKARMEEKLKSLNIIDTIISEMYTPPPRQHLGSIAYSKILNMLIISRNILFSQYYDYRYPVAVNFARIGNDILKVLINTIPVFMEQYKANNIEIDNDDESPIGLPRFDVNCLRNHPNIFVKDYANVNEEPAKALQTILSAAKISGRALSSFVTAIDGGEQITGAAFDSDRIYETLGLTRRLRLPGLRSYNDNELFSLAYMQRHCSIPLGGDNYARIKPYVEGKFSEIYLFNATWGQVQFLQLANSCPVLPVLCRHLL